MYLSKKLFGLIVLFVIPLFGISQQIPHEEVIFPDYAVAGQAFAIHVYSNYNLEDVMIFSNTKDLITHDVRMGNQKDMQFINHYLVTLQAPDFLVSLPLELMLTWNNGIKRNVQVFDRTIPVLKEDLNAVNRDHVGRAIFAASRKSVQIYPNPSQGEFLYLEFNDPEERPALLKVYDVFGQLVDEMVLEDGRNIYRANRLKNGNYIFTFYGESSIISEKVKIAHE